MPTRQTSSSGRAKSPRIQVVLPEDLCERLTALAERDSRSVSNMARVLIQQGVERLEAAAQAPAAGAPRPDAPLPHVTDRFRAALEQQGRRSGPRLQGAPPRLRLRRGRD
ncbi:MAG: ribbon-helix-helix domain-containing protein [Synechococcus sp.]